jgi:hypothetical protein
MLQAKPGLALLRGSLVAALAASAGGVHEAEHRMIVPLAEALWEAQRSGSAPDEQAYLERLRRL